MKWNEMKRNEMKYDKWFKRCEHVPDEAHPIVPRSNIAGPTHFISSHFISFYLISFHFTPFHFCIPARINIPKAMYLHCHPDIAASLSPLNRMSLILSKV
jgi:hypothetical protein